jgi:putative transposase
VFNYFLNARISQYRERKKSDNYRKQASLLTLLKRQEATLWLKEVNSQALQAALRNLDTAFENFFRGIARYPRFKSKRKKNSFSIPQFVSVCDGKIHFPKTICLEDICI